jgi:Rod binding domain-containing protein
MTTPPVDSSTLPADVRNGTTQDKQLYSTALQFENVLVQQLTKELDASADAQDDDGGDGTTQMYQGMLPGALAESITGSGGIGLANQLYTALKQ